MQSKHARELIIKRTFDASHEQVWKAWTDPKMLKGWWGPKNFTCPHSEIDLREGGKYLHCMRSAEGQDFWSTGTYKKIVPMKEIVCSDSFADEEGNIVPATHYGMDDNFPLEMEVQLKFKESDGKTTMTLKHVGIPDGEMKEMTMQGWNQSFYKLASLLK